MKALVDRVTALAAEARATKKMVGIMDARYMTVGHPCEITETYIAFDEPWELDSTGKLGGNDASGEKGLFKLILWSAVIHVELFPAMKGK